MDPTAPTPPGRRRLALTLAAGAALAGCAPLRRWWDGAPALPPAEAAALRALDRQGARALLAGDIDAAVATWQRYVAQAPAGLPRARQLRGHLTLLRREAARRFVQRATAAEAAAGRVRSDRLHVAVLPFVNEPPTGAAPPPPTAGFHRAVVAMIAVDLSRVPGITVLEREKTELLAQELRLGGTGLVDPARAARAGRMLSAGTVVGGSVLNVPGPAGPGSGRYRVGSAVGDVARGRLLGQVEVEGLQSEFFVLQKRIVHGILDLLDLRDRPAAVDLVHTRSWEAYARFARGLQLLSEDRFAEAREAFTAALGFDPGFGLAQDALADTPERPVSLPEIAAAAESAAR